jgi:hypothetical protein
MKLYEAIVYVQIAVFGRIRNQVFDDGCNARFIAKDSGVTFDVDLETTGRFGDKLDVVEDLLHDF